MKEHLLCPRLQGTRGPTTHAASAGAAAVAAPASPLGMKKEEKPQEDPYIPQKWRVSRSWRRAAKAPLQRKSYPGLKISTK